MFFPNWAATAEFSLFEVLAPLPPEAVAQRERRRLTLVTGAAVYLSLSLSVILLGS